jgi:LysM repeat protein
MTIYQVKLAAAATQADINADTNLTTAQRNVESKQLELDQLKANTLAVGQELPPDSSAQPPTPPARRTYTLRPGDTAAVISMIYGVPESSILAANPNVDFSRLRPGDAINLPRTSLTPVGAPRITPVGP